MKQLKYKQCENTLERKTETVNGNITGGKHNNVITVRVFIADLTAWTLHDFAPYMLSPLLSF